MLNNSIEHEEIFMRMDRADAYSNACEDLSKAYNERADLHSELKPKLGDLSKALNYVVEIIKQYQKPPSDTYNALQNILEKAIQVGEEYITTQPRDRWGYQTLLDIYSIAISYTIPKGAISYYSEKYQQYRNRGQVLYQKMNELSSDVQN